MQDNFFRGYLSRAVQFVGVLLVAICHTTIGKINTSSDYGAHHSQLPSRIIVSCFITQLIRTPYPLKLGELKYYLTLSG